MTARGKQPFKLPPLPSGSNQRQLVPSSQTSGVARLKSNSSIASTYSFQTRSSGSAEETLEKAAEALMRLCHLLKATYICRYNKLRRSNDVIITYLVRKTPKERLEIQRQFQQLYSYDLGTRLKESLSLEFAGIIDGLLLSPYSKLAMEFRQLIEDLDPFAMMDKLLMSGKRSLSCVCAEYKRQVGRSLIADAQRNFGDPRVSRLLAALVRGLLWPAAFTAEAAAVAAREAEGQETQLLEESGILLVGLQKYGPDFVSAVAEAHAAANPGKSLLQCVRATYDATICQLVRKLLDPAEAQARVREVAARLERLTSASGACVSQDLVHQLVLLTETPRMFVAVSRHLQMTRDATLRDLVTHRCPKDCAEVMASILSQHGR